MTDGKFFNISSGDVQIIEEENALVMPAILPLPPDLKSRLTSSSVLAKELSIDLVFLSVEKMHEVCWCEMLREKRNRFFNGLHSQKQSPESSTTQPRSPSFSDKTDSTKADSNPASTYQIQSMD
jgi:hypothetical protein